MLNKKITFIAEIGMNHNGNLDLLYSMIRASLEAGADIAKLQLGWRYKKGEINHITESDLEKIHKIAEFYGQKLMFSVITPEAFKMLKPFKPKHYKIASRTVVDNPKLVEDILSEGVKTYISLGFWDKNYLPFPKTKNIEYLWCKSLYPTPSWDLAEIPLTFNGDPYSGISDHTVGIEASLLGISRGALIVEKHFTFDKSDTTIRDHAVSVTPNEFSQLVKLGRQLSNITYQSIKL